MTNAPPTLDIVIVNWNSGAQLRACWESIAGSLAPSFRLQHVTVVDNASHDGSADKLTPADWPVEILRNDHNTGFAAACNQAAKGSVADYLLFLNPDTRLAATSLRIPVEFLETPTHRKVGIVGIQLVDDTGQVSRSCACFPTPGNFLNHSLGLDRLFPRWCASHRLTHWDHAESRQLDHVIGAFYLVRRALFQALDGFDKQFFVYLEDLDFSLRARQAGWSCWFLADTKAYHRGGATAETVSAFRLYHSLRSRLRYARKHFSRNAYRLITLATLAIEPCPRLFLAALCGSGHKLSETWKAYRLLWRGSS